MAALNDDSQSLVTFSLSPSPLGFYPPVPATISWLIFHSGAVLHLPSCVCPTCPFSFHSLQLKTSVLSPTSRKSCILLSVGASYRDKLLSQLSPPHPHQRHTLQGSSFRALVLGCAPFSSPPPPPPLLSGKSQRSACLQPWDADFLLHEQPQRLPLTAAVPDSLAPRHTLHVHKNTTPGLCLLLQKFSSA